MRAKIVSIVATALVVIFSSCKKETTTNPDPAKNTSVTAKVDGVRFQSNDALATQPVDSHIFTLIANDDKGNSIAISGNNTAGTHSSANDGDTDGIYTTSDGGVYLTANTGGSATFTITKYDLTTKKMSGTFSFTAPATGGSNATGTKTVTEGSFTDVRIIVN